MFDKLYQDKLASSGLSLEDGVLLGYRCITAEETKSLGIVGVKTSTLYIPYYDPATSLPYRCRLESEQETDFFRVRLLEEKKNKSILDMAAPSKPPAPYRQLTATGNYIYYPKTIELHGVKWADIITDSNRPIIITEGELKAAKTCKVGFPCLAVPGIFNWQSKAKGIDLVPSLKQVNFKNRTVYIAFDSDMVTNKGIRIAMLQLADKLSHLGAKVLCATVPNKKTDGKTGLDDYFVCFGYAENDVLMRNLKEEIIDKAELLSSYNELNAYNKEFCYIQSTGAIYFAEHRKTIDKTQFINIHENRFLLKQYVNKEGVTKVKSVSSAKEWLVWGHRQRADILAFEPGRKKYINIKTEEGGIMKARNTWTKWGVKPVEGDCTPFLNLISYLCSASEAGTKEWLLKWLAYPIQNAGAKLATAVVFVGAEGTGKGSLGKVLSRIYAGNYRHLDNNSFQEKYTGWGLKTSLLFADDISSMRNKDLMSQIKLWITEPVFPIRQMYSETFNIDNHINIIITTNNADAIKMSGDDRRFTIIQTPPFKQAQSFYDEYHKFLDNDEGAAKVMDYLLKYDLTGFNPKAEALKSSAKDTMTNTSSSDLNRFIRELLDNEDNECDLVTATDVLVRYRQDALATNSARSKVNINSVTKEFANLRFHPLLEGKKIRVSRDLKRKFYAGRNQKDWFTKTESQVKEHIDKYYREAEVVSYNESQDNLDTTDF